MMTWRRIKPVRMRRVQDFIRFESILPDAQLEALRQVERPLMMGHHVLPPSLDGLTLEQLSRFWAVTCTADLMIVTGEVLLGWSKRKVLRSPALPMIGLCNWVSAELTRICALWEQARLPRTSEEMQAGFDRLSFGVFGIADWYARRMGMHNHDEAFATPWPRIWQCLMNDTEEAAYARRLNEIYTNKHKIR